MNDDFCLIHGYEFMRCEKVWGAIPYCEACDNPGAALAEPTTSEAEISSQPERPNRELDSPDRGHTLVSLHQRGES
jgi:hypothetical protein